MAKRKKKEKRIINRAVVGVDPFDHLPMDTQKDLSIIVAVYGIFQVALQKEKLLDAENGRPLKIPKPKDKDEEEDDVARETLWLYSWMSEKVKGIQKEELMKIAEYFNAAVRSLHDEYSLSNLFLGYKIFQLWAEERAGVFEKKLLAGKILTLLRDATHEFTTVRVDEGGCDTYKDTMAAADNVYRMLLDRPELTKEMRDARIKRLQNKIANSPKAERKAS